MLTEATELYSSLLGAASFPMHVQYAYFLAWLGQLYMSKKREETIEMVKKEGDKIGMVWYTMYEWFIRIVYMQRE